VGEDPGKDMNIGKVNGCLGGMGEDTGEDVVVGEVSGS